MTGKKKTMEGGSFSLHANYTNKSINDIASKIIHGKKDENKIRAFSWINSNYLRAEQRINAFFTKLNKELTNSKQLDVSRELTLYNYFKDIVKKYPEQIEKIVKYSDDFLTAYNYFLTKGYDTDFNELKKILEKFSKKSQVPVKIKKNLNSQSVPVRYVSPQNEFLIMTNAKKQKLREDNNRLYEKLIEEFDEWYDRDFLKNYRNKRQITIPVEKKNNLFDYILFLADRIHGLGKHYMLPDYKDDDKLETLKKKLLILKELYKSVFIRSDTPINETKELFAKHYKNQNEKLNKKYINLIYNNQDRK